MTPAASAFVSLPIPFIGRSESQVEVPTYQAGAVQLPLKLSKWKVVCPLSLFPSLHHPSEPLEASAEATGKPRSGTSSPAGPRSCGAAQPRGRGLCGQGRPGSIKPCPEKPRDPTLHPVTCKHHWDTDFCRLCGARFSVRLGTFPTKITESCAPPAV